ncbi:DUF6522 family protein [Afipia birgiae]|jgi:hypothetical protein|uniref:DUF6522 family protein n=1 Tax=Afipia birgiae TaxID=151414 RepID=UPI000369AD80|nr:DUF6522 family protein [Afipia birgiae]
MRSNPGNVALPTPPNDHRSASNDVPVETRSSHEQSNDRSASSHHIEIEDGAFCVDSSTLGGLLHIHPADIPELMRKRAITTACERGIDDHEGQFRLSFFYGNRRGRLSVDESGRILQRSVVDFGERPPVMHKPQS